MGRVALPARLVAGAAGAAVLVTAAPPAYAQDEESGGGEVLCELHDPRLADPSGITAADGGNGWWIVPSGDNQSGGMAILRVGEDCAVDEVESMFIEHQPLDPQALAIDTDGFLWAADTGGAAERDSISVTQATAGVSTGTAMYRFVFPDGPEDVNAFVIEPDVDDPIFFSAAEGESTVYVPAAEKAEYDTPMEAAGTVALAEGGSVTGAAVNADSSKIVLRTENAAYEYTVEGGDVVAAVTGTEPVVTPLADEGTAQDIAYDADGNFNTLASTDGGDGTEGVVTAYTPGAPAAEEEEPAAEGDDAAPAEEEGPSLVDRVLDLGIGTIVNILAVIAILGLLTMVGGIMVIRKHKKRDPDDEDDDEVGFAREESGFGDDEGFPAEDPVDLGLDSGQPDPDLGQVARGGVYGGARQEPAGNVYGAKQAEPSGNVYGGAARSEPSGNVYGGAARSDSPPRPTPPAPPRQQQPGGSVYGGGAREEPQYGAFESGGNGSVYDDAGPGRSFSARSEPSGNVYGAAARPEPPAQPGGNVYGARGSAQGSVYGAGAGERTPDADEGYWGPSDSGGSTYGRGR